ncbi:hypothetical protein JCGZ_08400 [Jatropha curcas]|uniref:Uncharacterized protein n=2 Tax=Jatropha curcas TaxID=180498 RepID=A0A067KZV2_JATCU|nr:hypothetical protein JCGZ_08400 [Jatropha curcas]
MVEAQKCKPSRKVREHDECDQSNGADCCEERKSYTAHKRSPPVTKHTPAILTINSFEKGGDGGGPSECDGKYHDNDTPIVALSTGWYNKGKRCHHHIKIHANGRTVKAKVVDECDSNRGCLNNIVDASKAVWKALGFKESDDEWGWTKVTWADA